MERNSDGSTVKLSPSFQTEKSSLKGSPKRSRGFMHISLISFSSVTMPVLTK